MPLADRRVAARFEIVGELWGSVQTLEIMHLCNLAPEGALVESAVALPVGSIQPIRLVRGAETTELRAAVRHLSPIPLPGEGRLHRVGLEFLNVTEQAAASIGSLIEEQGQDSPQSEA